MNARLAYVTCRHRTRTLNPRNPIERDEFFAPKYIWLNKEREGDFNTLQFLCLMRGMSASLNARGIHN